MYQKVKQGETVLLTREIFFKKVETDWRLIVFFQWLHLDNNSLTCKKNGLACKNNDLLYFFSCLTFYNVVLFFSVCILV